MENNLPSHQRSAVKSVTARRTAPASATFVDIRFDSYRLHNAKAPWPSSMAIANNAQLQRLTLVVKKRVTVAQVHEFTLKRAANPNEAMISPISMAMRARKPIPRMISCIFELILMKPQVGGRAPISIKPALLQPLLFVSQLISE